MRYFNIKEFLDGHFDIFYKTRRCAMNFIKHIFSSLTPSFLIRNYFFGGIIVAVMFLLIWNNKVSLDKQIAITVIYTINLIFYPFATLVYDEIRDTLLGNTVLISDAKIMLIAKVTIKIIILGLAVPIGIIGIIYIWYRTKDNA